MKNRSIAREGIVLKHLLCYYEILGLFAEHFFGRQSTDRWTSNFAMIVTSIKPHQFSKNPSQNLKSFIYGNI